MNVLAVKPGNACAKKDRPAAVPPVNAIAETLALANVVAAEVNPELGLKLENLKRLSLRWLIRRGIPLAEAEDVYQQSVLKALTSEAELRDHEKLQSWFMQILKHTLLDGFRKQKQYAKVLELDPTLESTLAAETEELENSFCQCVTGFLADLPASDQGLLRKHSFEGQSFADLAQETSESEGKLRVKSHRAREKLKQMFQACCHVRKFRDLADCGCA